MVASFTDTLFDIELDQGYSGGPSFKTEVHKVRSGKERRNQLWEESRWKGNAGNKKVDEELKDYMLSFFMARRGRAQGFLFLDLTDYRAEDVELPAVGEETLQLSIPYEPGDNVFVRPIYKPVEDSITMKLNDSAFTDFNIDWTTGLITFTSEPYPGELDTLTWSGQFYIPVRFDTDEFEATPTVVNGDYGLYDISSLPMIEIKPEDADWGIT